jgi:hypothetical protein
MHLQGSRSRWDGMGDVDEAHLVDVQHNNLERRPREQGPQVGALRMPGVPIVQVLEKALQEPNLHNISSSVDTLSQRE